MSTISLPVNSRAVTERAAYIREEHLIPGVIYGHGFANLHVKMPYQSFKKVFEKATFSTLVTLDIEGGEKVPVLIHDVQYNPVTDTMIHVDFYAVRMDEKVETKIALEFVGVSEAVKAGAVLNTNKHELHISCLPADLVHTITVDISALTKIGDIIRVSAIKAPAGITILDHGEEPIVSAIELRIVQEEEPVAAAETVVAVVPGAEGEVKAGEAAAGAEAKGAEAGAKAEKGEKKEEKKKGK